MSLNPSISTKRLQVHDRVYEYYALENAPGVDGIKLNQIPLSIRVLLEGALRKAADGKATFDDVKNILQWTPQQKNRPTIPVFPGRVVLQDFTGVPVVNDLAAMRTALVKQGGKPEKINPVIPVDLVIDLRAGGLLRFAEAFARTRDRIPAQP